MIDYELLNAAWEYVRKAFPNAKPKVGAILGSGWGHVVDSFQVVEQVAYTDIPGLRKTGVAGHAGQLVLAKGEGIETLIFQGRRHYYEGEGWTPIAIPLFLMKQMEIPSVVLTNAAGGIREDLNPGDFMIMEDHINFIGDNPLIGKHNAVWGDRFIDQSEVYNKPLRDIASKAATAIREPVKQGTYIALSGPFYETPAEIRAYRTLGADAVGMSTVPEAQLATAAGLKVLGISCITNKAAGLGDHLSHEEVIEVSKTSISRMQDYLVQIWKELAAQ